METFIFFILWGLNEHERAWNSEGRNWFPGEKSTARSTRDEISDCVPALQAAKAWKTWKGAVGMAE